MSVTQFFIEMVRLYPYRVVLVTLLLAFAAMLEMFGLGMSIPILAALFENRRVDEGIVSDVLRFIHLDDLSLAWFLAIFVIFLLGKNIVLFFSDLVVGRVAVLTEREYKNKLMDGILHAAWQFHLSRDPGRLSNLVLRETERIGYAITRLGRMCTQLLISTILILTSFFVSFHTIIIGIFLMFPLFVLARKLNILTRIIANKTIDARNECNAQVLENMNQAKVIKTSAMEVHRLSLFEIATSTLANYKIREVLYSSLMQRYPDVIAVTVVGGLLYFLYYFAPGKLGDMVFSVLLIYRAYGNMSNFQKLRRALIGVIPGYEVCKRLFEEVEDCRELRSGTVPADLKDSIRMSDVRFRYDDRTPVITGIDMDIRKGWIVALVGKSGAGKTTIVDILLRLHKPSGGTITVDSVDLEQMDVFNWRQRTGYVPQDPVLFRGTIRDNIVGINRDTSDVEIDRAVKMAHAYGFIQEFPDGYDTQVGDQGLGLSGGQKQRIALARALIHDPDLLILDEATSALDGESERSIRDAILKLREQMAIVVIAHRQSFIEVADRIYVVKDGTVVESGSAAELVALRGEFCNLYSVSD